MLRPYDLLENVLIDIEKGLKKGVNSDNIAGKYELSEGHLRRLFRFAFKQSIAGYIRSRKLSSSLNELLKTDANIIDIALSYGYRYEQTYIRAFKEEFGVLPGLLRKTGQIVKVKPPLHLFDENKLKEGVLFGPEIVMIPEFHIAGISQIIPFNESETLAPKAAIQFWENNKKHIGNINNPNIYIGLTCNINRENENSEYITSVHVKNFNKVPEGYRKYTFGSCLCARFRYIGQHHYYEINSRIAGEMYYTIWKFANDKQQKFALMDDKVHFEKIDIDCYDGKYCQMEWFAPVMVKK
ncbi:MAG: helix-turn-helix domain-containing protein [Treponema sp.]|nr:helix-turn-helix domain-containing protein [Treponema sp.]